MSRPVAGVLVIAAALVVSGCGAAVPAATSSSARSPGGAVSSSAPGSTGSATPGSSPSPGPTSPGPTSGGSNPSGSTSPGATSSGSPGPGDELADSVTLRSLGFTYGPLDTLPVPRGSLITARVDQPNVVTLVFVSPDAAGLYAFYTDTLPGAGYRIDAADAATATLSFSGSGWRGDVTGTGSDSALVLRPD